jgi:hypothetical protein
MNKIIMVLTAVVLVLGGTFASLNGQTAKVYKIGLAVWTGYPTSVKGFKDAMTAGGFVEGKNIEYLFGQSGLNRYKQLFSE